MYWASNQKHHSVLMILAVISSIIISINVYIALSQFSYADEVPAKSATVTIDPDDTSGSEIESLVLAGNASNNTYSEWVLTTVPAKGYYLSHIHNVSSGADIESVDGTTVNWKERRDGAEYYAVFKTVIAEPIKVSCLNQGMLFENQRVLYKVKIQLRGCLPKDTPIRMELYSDDIEDIQPIARTEYYHEVQEAVNNNYVIRRGDMPAGEYELPIIVPQMPVDCNELSLVIKTGADSQETNMKISVPEVRKSGNCDLEYLDIPGGIIDGNVGGYWSYGEKGPSIFDAASFVDPITGELHTYFATTSGIVYSNGFNNTEMPLDGKGTNIIAVGGENEKNIYAIALGRGGVGSNGATICQIINGALVSIPGTYTGDYHYDTSSGSGLVMSFDSIWLDNIHWNGSSWVDNDIQFNSFYKADSNEAYAGSENGIYKYSDGVWSKINDSSEKLTIISGVKREEDIKLLCVHNGQPTLYGRTQGRVLKNATDLQQVTIQNEEYQVSNLDLSDFNGKITGATVDYDGNVYAFKKNSFISIGVIYEFPLVDIYKYVDGEWMFQYTDAFNSSIDKTYLETGVYDKKGRSNEIGFGVNTVPGVTYFLGGCGAVYVKYGETTISFNSMGGNEISPITNIIGNKITQPKSPVKNGAVFGGWYTDLEDSDSLYQFKTMPAKDITLYAKWYEEGSPEYEQYINLIRTKALEALDEVFGKLYEDSYEESDWERILNLYSNGKQAIEEAEDEDSIHETVDETIAAMLGIEPKASSDIKVCLSMELFTLGEGYIIKPTIITVPQYEQVSVLLTDQLQILFPEIEPPYRITGAIKHSFYLASVYSKQLGWIGEFDNGDQSGWMYCVNNLFPSVGASSWCVEDGDVVRWQYTVSGLGADLGTSEEWQQGGEQVAIVADKDALTWLVAEVNAKIEEDAEYLSKYDLTDSYNSAMTALTTMYSSQEEVDAAEEALQTSFNDAIKKEKAAQMRTEISEEIESASGINNEDGKYTEESFKTYKAAVAAAEKILAMPENEVDNDTLSATLDAIKDAKANLVETTDQGGDSGDNSGDDQGSGDGGDSGGGTEPGDSGDGDGSGSGGGSGNEQETAKVRADLNAALADAEKITNADGRYTAESYKALMDAVNYARQTLANSTATLEQLNLALDAIKDAKANLVETTDQGGDSGDNSGDDQGSGDGGDSESGTEPGGSGDGEDSGSGGGSESEEQITKVRADLNAALTDAGTITNADGRYTAESYKALMDAVNFARQTLANSTATLEQLNLALDAVTKAKAGLVETAPSEDKKDDSKEDPKEGDTSVEPVKKAVVINYKKVTASVVKKALKKANNTNATVVTLGKKVKTIKKGAFKKTRIKTLIVKTKKLKKASVKGCLKSSKVKTVKVKVGNKKANKSFVKKYRKIFTKKNAGRKVRVK